MRRLRHPASVEDVNYQSPRGLDRALFLSSPPAAGAPLVRWSRFGGW